MRGCFLLLAMALFGCPPSQSSAERDAAVASPSACAKFGQTCEYAPGKLGTCVAKDDCQSPAGCFVCQSQH